MVVNSLIFETQVRNRLSFFMEKDRLQGASDFIDVSVGCECDYY